MNRPVVVDASVAVKWVVEEDYSDRAEELYAASLQFRYPVLAPSLMPNEVANAIYQRLRQGKLSELDATDAIARFLGFTFTLMAPAELPRPCICVARMHGLKSIYDSLYVLLAQQLGTDLWTDDRALLRSVAHAAPWVRWIGDYTPTRPNEDNR